jgi:hypothetical protein
MPNLWRQFQDLLPTSTTLIGTVVTTHADHTVSVQLLDGGLLRVAGSAADGTRVFIRDGRIEGEAPELPQVDIEI